MHLVRSPFLNLAALLLGLPVLVTATGCGSDVDHDPAGPTVTATGPEHPTTSATSAAATKATSAPADLPAIEAVCAPYADLVDAVREAAASSSDPEEIAAEIAPLLKEFAAQVPDLERPPGVSAETWAGIEALAARIVALPDAPSRAEIEAVMAQLTAHEKHAFDEASEWLKETCA